MDWRYILSLTPEDLEDEEKEELFNSVAWFECDTEDIDLEKCKALFRVSQEILKFKKEQVETLLHELEEMAIKQGEEEARRLESDTDARSSRSRMSSSIEFENLEQKYMELRTRYKKVMKNNDKYKVELEKANSKIKEFEQETRRLQNEIESRPLGASSDSDVSETIRDQHKELVEAVHNKNKQISDLLQDIEEVEKENFILRDKLSSVRDELSTATKEITMMTEILKARDTALEEKQESHKQILIQYEVLQRDFEELQREKDSLRQEMEEFAAEMDTKVDEWKKIMDQKDAEILDLKSRLQQTSVNSSLSSLPNDDLERSQINVLQRILSEREQQLLEVQTQLQVATKEMEESTEIMKRLKSEREQDTKKIKELNEATEELRKQLKTVHERCQNLQEEVAYAEKISSSKGAELKVILSKMKENGQVDLVAKIEELQELKVDNRIKEKHITNLVKACNSLQDSCDVLEKENSLLRDKLGIPEDEQLTLSGYTTKQKKQKKEFEALRKQLSKMEEEKLDLKSEVHRLNGIVSSLTNQLLDLGQKPLYDKMKTEPTTDWDLRKENKALVDENEALRKGMHEILNSVNVKKGSSLNEIKSETLEQLLRALDVKHISGWYHPAMRLQAELHNLEGINIELREQLREVRVEVQKYKTILEEKSQATEKGLDTPRDKEQLDKVEEEMKTAADHETVEGDQKKSKLGIEGGLTEDDVKDLTEEKVKSILIDLFKKYPEEIKTVSDSKEFGAHFGIIQQVILLFKGLFKEKASLEESLKNVEENYSIAEMKLNVLEGNETDQEKLKKLENLVLNNVSLTRKVTYLEKETNELNKKLDNVNIALAEAELQYQKNNGELLRMNKTLENDLRIMKNLNEISVEYEIYKQLQKDLDGMTIKYRELVAAMKEESEAKSLEVKMLQEAQNNLERDKVELKDRLTQVLSKITLQSVEHCSDKVEKLSQKLAECEVNEMTERQRANHTNNLYELVKEQLNKSEERFREYSKYNEELLKKNLILQEQLKQTEDNLCEYIDKDLHKQLQTTNNELLKENGNLVTINSKLREDLKLAKEAFNNQSMWNSCKQQELLYLKHQIVDLISVSDEKIIIAQLNSDLLHCRQSENFYRAKLEDAVQELRVFKEKVDSRTAKFEQEKVEAKERESQLNKKIGILQNLLSKQKQQYLGCVPLCCEEIYLENLKMINKEKHETFLCLHKIKTLESEIEIQKQQLEIELQNVTKQKQILAEGDKEEIRNVLNWMQEKKILQINELRYKRQSEFKEAQLQHFKERVRIQDEQLAKLDEELLLWHKNLDINSPPKERVIEKYDESPKPNSPILKTTKTADVQTDEIIISETEDVNKANQVAGLKTELVALRKELEGKENNISHLKSKISELEMTVSLFRKQIGDKQSQITFYERHILELQNKKEDVHTSGAGGDNINVGVEAAKSNDEILALKTSVKTLQDNVKSKEEEIIKYQTLLKADRDNHSLAAARLQEELQNLQKALSEEKQKYVSMEETFSKARPNRAAIEQYMTQVHALEKHTAELHTKITSLEAQLQSSRQEAVRWRSLANDRLAAMEELRNSLEEQHKNELSIYKTDSEKLKELGNDEINRLKQLLVQHKSECTGHLDVDIERLVREKDERIHDLTVKLRQLKNDARKNSAAEKADSEASPKLGDLEASKELLMKEHELLKKRYEQLINKERGAREEIRDLKAQLLKKPSAVRTDRSDKSIKEQLQRKISSLENEIVDLKQNLAEQMSINETHRVQASEDFEKWKKMKHWQQAAEKLKNKLKERDNEMEKLQQTCSGYRMLIERLEREKHNLENRIKSLKSNAGFAATSKEIEALKIENMKLLADVEALSSRLEMQQHHSGGLGAAMMQEKLESQERKIAVLELTSKGTVEVRAEFERLQDMISALQKRNLCLEAENLDLKLDLEKSNKEVPRLSEQIQHLESYIDVLKNENTLKELDSTPTHHATTTEPKKVSELERTVFMLKRVVEKLQAENKRLVSAEKLKRDHARLKEQHAECVQKISRLEQELAATRSKAKSGTKERDNDNIVALSDELASVRDQLEQKSHLLDKVKVLLHRAATKEKALLEEISELRSQRDSGISPIQEESEDSSDL